MLPHSLHDVPPLLRDQRLVGILHQHLFALWTEDVLLVFVGGETTASAFENGFLQGVGDRIYHPKMCLLWTLLSAQGCAAHKILRPAFTGQPKVHLRTVGISFQTGQGDG